MDTDFTDYSESEKSASITPTTRNLGSNLPQIKDFRGEPVLGFR